MLGLPVPDEDLADYLSESRPTALVLSCTEPLALVGVRDAVAAAHRVGCPVLVGGAGLGPDDRRARALGADGWAGGVGQAVAVLRRWRLNRPSSLPPRRRTERSSRCNGCMTRSSKTRSRSFSRRVESLRRYGQRQVEQVHGDLRLIVALLSCALLVQDDRLFSDFVRWNRGLDRARGSQDAVTEETLRVIDEALGAGFAGAHRMLAEA